MPDTHYLIYIFLFIAALLSIVMRKLTLTGGITGFIIGALVYLGAGYNGVSMLAIFFIAGTLATSFGCKKKQTIKPESTQRTAGQVFANGGVAAILGLLAWLYPEQSSLMQLMIAGSLASALADTLSSELGTIYGQTFYNILTLKPDQRGLDGVVSFEGTHIGIWGSALIGIVYCCKNGVDFRFAYIVVAGTIGNLTDSVLGAALERKHRIGNNTVNFLNTLTGAIVCLLLAQLFA